MSNQNLQKRNLLSLFCLFCLFSFFMPKYAMATWSVWTEPLLVDKVRPSYNPASKPASITIKGAKNEWLAFLVPIRVSGETASAFVPSVETTLTDGSNTIADSNFVFYMVADHQTTSSGAAYEPAGHWPDACVPYRDRWYNEIRNSTEEGWNKTIPADTTRLFLVELYIPANANAGSYNGAVKLTSNGSATGTMTQNISINLTVWNFSLPEQWSLQNLWGFQGSYHEFDNTALGARNEDKAREWFFRMAQSGLDHGVFYYGSTGRFTNSCDDNGGFTNPYFDGANDQWSWKKFLDGTAPQNHNPKAYPITSVFSVRSHSGFTMYVKPVSFPTGWATWIDGNGYRDTTIFVDKFSDEPPNIDYINNYFEDFNQYGGWKDRHDGQPDNPYEYFTAGNNSYPSDTTGTYWGREYKQLWCITQMYTWYRPFNWNTAPNSPDAFDSRKATYGDILWTYWAGDNDKDAATWNVRAASSSSVDAYSRNNAYPAISCWKFKSSGIHYWMVNYGWGNNKSTDQAWENITPFIGHGDKYNGDGLYYYPGRPSGSNHDIGGQHEIPIESLRLKLFRWGAQVYEYCKLLESQGKSSVADEQVANMITFNVPNTITIHNVPAWETAREAMASEIEGTPPIDQLNSPADFKAASNSTATFSWTPNTETNLAGYKIYYGFSHNGPYNQFKDIGNPEINNGYIIASISGLNDGEVYYFVATAYDNQGNESNYSDEAIWTCPNPQTPGEIVLVPTGEMTLVGVDSEETTGEDGRGINAIDGDPATIWHTDWSAATPSHPHEIVIDLGYGRQICGFNYLPRQDGYYNGSIGQYEFFVSMDPNNWGGSVASGTWSATSEKQEISFDAKTARYVKLVALSEVAGNPWTSAAEVEVMEHLGQGENGAPTNLSFTTTPSSLNNPGETITFNVSATDPDGDSLTYTISFGDGTANGSGSEVVHTYEAGAGEPPHIYTATVTVSDGHGHSVGDSLQVTVNDIPPAEPTNVSAN